MQEEIDEETTETIIKSSLFKYLNHKRSEKALEAIKSRVKAFSKRINIASVALATLLKQEFEGVKDVSSVIIPDIFNETFIRHLLLGSHEARKGSKVGTFFSEYPCFLKGIVRYHDDSNMYTRGAKKYIVNLKNGFMMNFEKRLKTFLNNYQRVYGISKNERILMYYKILGWSTLPKDLKHIVLTDNLQSVVNDQRHILGLEDGTRISKSMLKNQTFHKNVLRQWVFFNRFYEIHGFKLFGIVPIARVKSTFISIDREGLYGICCDCGLLNDCTRNEFLDGLTPKYWKKLFNMDKIIKTTKHSEKVFTEVIDTDGVSMCVHFKAPKRYPKGEECMDVKLGCKKGTRVLGLDPGRVNIYTISEIDDQGHVKSFTLTRNHYYLNSGIFKAREETNKWSKGIKDALVEMSKVSIKGVNFKAHVEYLGKFFKNYDVLEGEYSKPRWARQRLRLYGGKRKTFDQFFKKVKGSSDLRSIEIAYGSAKFAPGGKNEISVPTTRAFKECSSRFKTKIVDEFRTSKINNKTYQVLQGVTNKDAKSSKQFLRGLHWCDSTSKDKNGKFVSRDVNAALNIRMLGLVDIRPLIFSRDPSNKKLEIVLGKRIKNNKCT